MEPSHLLLQIFLYHFENQFSSCAADLHVRKKEISRCEQPMRDSLLYICLQLSVHGIKWRGILSDFNNW